MMYRQALCWAATSPGNVAHFLNCIWIRAGKRFEADDDLWSAGKLQLWFFQNRTYRRSKCLKMQQISTLPKTPVMTLKSFSVIFIACLIKPSLLQTDGVHSLTALWSLKEQFLEIFLSVRVRGEDQHHPHGVLINLSRVGYSQQMWT